MVSRIYDIGICDIQRIALLTNPSAGSNDIVKVAAVAKQRFDDSGVDALNIQAKDETATQNLSKEMLESGNVEAIVVCGDDNLMNVVLQV